MNIEKILYKLEAKRIKHDLYSKLSVQLKYGLNLKDSLQELSKRAKRNGYIGMFYMIQSVTSGIINGSSFAESIKDWVPSIDYTIISSSEKSGKLPESLELIIELDGMKDELKKEFTSGLATPLVLFLAIYGLLYYLGKYALPQILGIVHHVTGFAVTLVYLADFVNSVWLYIAPVIVLVLVAVMIYSMPRWTGKLRAKVDKFFPYSIYRLYIGSIFFVGLSGLISSGVNETESLKEMSLYSNNYLKERISSFVKGMQNGLNLGDSMSISRFDFPDRDIVDDISVFSNFPEFDKKLALISQTNMKLVKEKIRKFSKTTAFIFNLFVYGLIFLIVGGVMSLVMNVSSSVNKF